MKKALSKRLLMLFTVLCLLISTAMPAMAVTSGASENPADGILSVYYEYQDDEGNVYQLMGGTCFLINDEYVISNYHVFNLNQTTTVMYDDGTVGTMTVREYACYLLGLTELRDDDSHLRISVYANRDMSVKATIHESVQSQSMDYVALKLSAKIYDRQPLVLGDSDAVQQADAVYAYGFPADSYVNKEFNTTSDVTVTDGIVSKVVETDTDLFEHTAVLNNGNSGGPLLNANNEVIGVNEAGNDTKYYAIQINLIKSGLDTFGIAYTDSSYTGIASADDTTEDTTTADSTDTTASSETAATTETPELTTTSEEDVTEVLAALNTQISEAKAIEQGNYTDESYAALGTAIDDAEEVANNASATKAQIEMATDDLSDAVNALEEKEGLDMMMIIIIAVVAVVVVVIIILIVVSSNNKKRNQRIRQDQRDGRTTQRPPYTQVGPGGQGGTTPQPPVTPPQQQAPPEGAGETTLLNSGAGETTLLSGQGASAYLIRKKNGEKIVINSQNFSIGKERRRVNYCVSDNTSVSRYHVVISKKGSDYYAADQNSSNFTFVNGVQLSPMKEKLLTDKSVLKLSDEEFEFHLS